eukprot:scaffold5903_cov81-Skeletonema_menzelii.AAC.6
MGAILALAENWHVSQGIFYVLSNILGLATPLTDAAPDTTPGKVMDVVISSIALGYIAIFADYVTTLNPSSYVRFKIRGYLIALGVVTADSTAIAHPLRQPSIHQRSKSNGGGCGGDHEDNFYDNDEGGEEETTTRVKSLLVGSLPATSTDTITK